ncbi:MAG: hypothetical protein KatS3mg030_680 [Saprospiraceae bacterium]|nr:MAG: hypothetical protein KatS3mg030_680 [Saprospiraceae bacterium]
MVAGLLLCHLFLSLLANGVLFQQPAVSFLFHLQSATGHWVQPTLVANVINISVVLGLGVVWIGGWRWADLGWRWSHFARALAILAGLVMLWQLLLAFIGWMAIGDLHWHERAQETATSRYLGSLLAQFFGNALYEESFFRVFLFTQILNWFRRHSKYRWATAMAVLFSQAIFALSHLPNRVWVHHLTNPEALLFNLLWLFAMGIGFQLLWLWTRNLWIVVGLHALDNKPFSLADVPIGAEDGVLELLILIIVLVGVYEPIRHKWTSLCTGVAPR